MVCVLILFYKFFLSVFRRKKNLRGGGGGGGGGGGEEEFQLVLVSPHHEFLVVKMFSNGTMNILLVLEKLRNKIFRLAIAGHLPFKCYVL